ncbi:MAG: exonuclease SbcCD subunit D C-terminal domain-containing protein [Kiritimatiellia bacterium]|jgi:exonuclease SbcD
MRILHTSDWHIGRMLYGQRRHEEFEAFLDWLATVIRENEIGALLVAGDVFDTSAPGNLAQELYYRFLCRVVGSECRHVVVVAGNHDSPSFLEAPKELLKVLDVHVVGNIRTDAPEDEVLVLKNAQGAPELIVCAVPYLRDRDIRTVEAGESAADKDQKLADGIRRHYADVVALAETKRAELGGEIPIVAMGHLFTAGGQTVDGDGVRELYVGALAQVEAEIFPEGIDYLALGHLHVPQRVRKSETRRYSGSPLPMGFGEARQRKSVCQVEFNGREASVQLIEVPVFQRLERIEGDWDKIARRMAELAAEDSASWLEVVYSGDTIIGDLRERVEEAVEGSRLKVLRIRNNLVIAGVLKQVDPGETLDKLSVNDVFERCLVAKKISEEQWPGLRRAYQEVVESLREEGAQVE